MDAVDGPIIGVVDGNNASWLVQLVWRQLCFFVLFQKFTLIQVSYVVVTLSHGRIDRTLSL